MNSLATRVLVLGPQTLADLRIRRAVEASWPRTLLRQAEDADSAARMLGGAVTADWPGEPDLIIAKVADPERARGTEFSAIRRHRLFRDAPLAAFIDSDNPGRFECVRGYGVTAILTRQRLEQQFTDIVDAVTDRWLFANSNECGDRYYCPVCSHCLIARIQPRTGARPLIFAI